jgi:hypothetical protein
MTDDDRCAIDEARATIARLERLTPRDETIRSEVHTAGDRMEPGSWRRNVTAQEPKRRELELDTLPIDWSAVIDARLADLKSFTLDVLAEAFKATLEIERAAVAAALSKRDAAIGKLEREIAEQAATVARLEVRLLEADRNRVLDLPHLPLHKAVN